MRPISLRSSDRKDALAMRRYHWERQDPRVAQIGGWRLRHVWLAFDGLPYDDLGRQQAMEDAAWWSRLRSHRP